MKNILIIFLVCTAVLAHIPLGSKAYAAGLEKQGRWFSYDGQPIYLVGVDAQQLAADSSLDYISILDQFEYFRINKVRIWLDAYWNPSGYLHPWNYNSGTGKYDLESWNASYWNRLKAIVAAAKERGIMVEISLFDAYPSDTGWWTSSMRIAWNKAYNINGAYSSNASGHFFPEFFDLNLAEKSYSGKTLKDYQKALIDKALLELDSYPNVYYEVMNEFFEYAASFPNGFATVAPWQQYWADYLRQKTTHIVVAHVNDAANPQTGTEGVEYFWNRPSVDVLNYHLYNTDPGNISSLLHTSQDKGKILQNNESYEWYLNGAVNLANLNKVTKEAWGWFLSGGYYGFYNGQHTEYSGWSQLGQRAKVLRDLADKVRFWEMSPVDGSNNEYDSFITQGPSGSSRQLLANPGSQYLAYFWGTPSTTNVRIQLSQGSYAYEWYDPRNGALLGSGSVVGGGVVTITAPSASLWDGSVGTALFILRNDVLAPAAPTGLNVI